MDDAIPKFTTQCRNCGATLHGEFCSRCGQLHRHERLRVRDWWADLVEAATDADSRVLRTVIGLAIRPGQMAREYVEGRRVEYVTPFRYAVGTCALWWLAVSLNPAAASLGWAKYGQAMNLALVPVLALCVLLAFVRSGYNYAEQLAFTYFVTAQLFLWRVPLALTFLLGAAAAPIAPYVNLFDQILFFAYFAWALWGFHRGRVRFIALRIIGAEVAVTVVGIAANVALVLYARHAARASGLH